MITGWEVGPLIDPHPELALYRVPGMNAGYYIQKGITPLDSILESRLVLGQGQ